MDLIMELVVMHVSQFSEPEEDKFEFSYLLTYRCFPRYNYVYVLF